MFNVEETFDLNPKYFVERDLYLKGFGYSFGVIIFIESIRRQVAEVNILQLIPGFYLLLLFISFLFLLYFSTLFYELVLERDKKKFAGIKILMKMTNGVLMKLSFLLFVTEILLVLQTVIPISLECFNSYGEQTLDNTWSLDEVIGLEIILLGILLLLSQFPLVILKQLMTQISIQSLPRYWKPISFGIIVSSGFLTPTIDGYTQLSFASSTLSLYLLLLNFSQKRLAGKNYAISLIN